MHLRNAVERLGFVGELPPNFKMCVPCLEAVIFIKCHFREASEGILGAPRQHGAQCRYPGLANTKVTRHYS